MKPNIKLKFVYVENDGTVRELDNTEIEYLQTEFEPTDSARPYIKSSYSDQTPDGSISGFLLRKEVPESIEIITTDLRFVQLFWPISVLDSNKAIKLSVGTYRINVLGGWSVSVGDFSIELKSKNTGKIIRPKVTNWRFQSYEFSTRAKRIMKLDISEPGVYFIDFEKQNDLIVRRSNLFFLDFFKKKYPLKS